MNHSAKAGAAEVEPYLEEIAQRLWSGHAAILIGSGFSKNAVKAVPTAPDFPTWHELGDLLYQKLHGAKPTAGAHHYLNPLKLADEVRAAYGGPVLDNLVRACLPDKEHEPSDVHVRLLELPWVDIFTTNYDTLLERATSKVTSRRFDIVTKQGDLIYSTRPRIVKLHGSLPATAPFVVSEDDYRRYPRECAPFVNCVQQSLLENTLCLIGFSGDDPNFLHWIGWVRDNLGSTCSPKLYMVGASSVSAPQRQLLADRNIVVLELSAWRDNGGDHGRAFLNFTSYLLEKKPAPLEWPTQRQTLGIAVAMLELTDEWRSQRLSYPNWVVAPEPCRERLWFHTRSQGLGARFFPPPAGPIGRETLLFLYELNWRLERALYPLPDDVAKAIDATISQALPTASTSDGANPFGANERVEGGGAGLTDKYVDLALALLRYYREEGNTQQWKVIYARVNALRQRASPEQVARLSYERALQAVFALDVTEAREAIAAWTPDPTQPLWEAKRAAVIAEMGDIAAATNILESALATIRSNQQLAPVVSDFTWVSQECHVMHLLHLVKATWVSAPGSREAADRTSREFRDRWNDLKPYGCDPWNEMALFEARLKAPHNQGAHVTRERLFDIGRETVTWHVMPGTEDLRLAYAFLRYCEEVGLPFVLPFVNVARLQAERAAQRIADTSSWWGVVTMARIGGGTLADQFFGRQALARHGVARIDQDIERFARVLSRVDEGHAETQDVVGQEFGAQLGRVVPEILSRLCTRCSPELRRQLLVLIADLYQRAREPGDGVAHLVERLLAAMSLSEQAKNLLELLAIPIPAGLAAGRASSFPEPFRFVRVRRIPGMEPPVPARAVVERLIATIATSRGEERVRACSRARALDRLAIFSQGQRAMLAEALWSYVGPDAFPAATPFLRWVFLELPIPRGVDAVALFRQYVLGFSFDSLDKASGGMSVSEAGGKPVVLTGGSISMCTDLLMATSAGLVGWSVEDARALLGKMVAWWDSGKERLLNGDSRAVPMGVAGELRSRYANLVRVLAQVVVPSLQEVVDGESKQRIDRLLNEFDVYGVPALRAQSACLLLFPERRDSVLTLVRMAITSLDRSQATDGLNAMRVLVRLKALQGAPEIQLLVSTLAEQIRWRRAASLVDTMGVARDIVKEAPQWITPQVLADFLDGLRELRRETNPLSADGPESVDLRLAYRKTSVSLARAILEYSVAQRKDPPAECLEWQRVAQDPQEYAEIRAHWEEQ